MDFALNMPLTSILPSGTHGSMDAVRAMAKALETAGVSAALTSEHPAPSSYWLHNDPTGHDCLDPFVALSFIAAVTTKLKVFSNIIVLPYRNPFMTAKAAATAQVLSDNRFILGVGIGYQEEEFEALGVAFKERGKLTDEALETIRQIWAGGSVVKKGMHFNAVGNEARPVPKPAPPIWVGGGSYKAVERAAKLGDGWLPHFSVPTNDPIVANSSVVSMENFGQKVARIHELRGQLGRTEKFDVSVAPPFRPKQLDHASAQRFLGEVKELEDLGATWIWTSIPSHSVEEYLDVAAWYGEEIIAVYNKG